MKLRCLIIDDEPLAHQVIIEYAREIPFLEISGQCYLATEALSKLNQQDIDLIFLDIHMPKIKGLDFLRTLPRKPFVIVTSAHEEYALESFELDVSDYLMKPFRFDRFLKAVNKVAEIYQLKNAGTTSNVSGQPALPEEPQHLFIKSDKRHIQIDLGEVDHLESYGNYVKVWQQANYHLTPGTLTGFESQLPTTDFFRIHKSHIINRRYIDYVEGNFLVLKNGTQLPIGKNYRKGFHAFIG